LKYYHIHTNLIHMRRKRSKRQASPIRMPKAPKKEIIQRRKRKFHLPKIFKKEKSRYPTRRKKNKNLKYILLPVFFLAIVGIIYLSIKYVLFLRENAYSEKKYEITNVIGLEDIPTFGGSEFLFSNNMDDSVVKQFLSGGNSAYRIPSNKTTEDVEKYYSERLPDLGWEFIQSIPIGTPDKKYGQYWVKDGKGLRIYSKFNDIWYESITENDSRTALSQLIQEEIEREMLMASNEKQDLLPDYPWRIEIPKEYLIKYFPTDFKNLRAVSFQKIGSTEIVEIYPIGTWKQKELDFMLNDYCKIKSTQENKYGVMNSIPISFRDTLGLKSSIQTTQGSITAYTIPNTFNSIVYVISTTQANSPLLGYIIDNIKPLGSKD